MAWIAENRHPWIQNQTNTCLFSLHPQMLNHKNCMKNGLKQSLSTLSKNTCEPKHLKIQLSSLVVIKRHPFSDTNFQMFLNVFFRLSKVRKGSANMQKPSASKYCTVTRKYSRGILSLPRIRPVSQENKLFKFCLQSFKTAIYDSLSICLTPCVSFFVLYILLAFRASWWWKCKEESHCLFVK